MNRHPVNSVRFPAKVLMLLGAASVLAMLFAAGLMVYFLATGQHGFQPVVALVILLPWIAGNSVVFVGALRMADLRNYRLAWLASLLALVPFPGPPILYPFGLIFGGISVIALLQPRVKRAFADAALDPAASLAASSHRSMAALLKHLLLAMLVIASAATLASATSAYWWRGSAGLAWAAIAVLEFVAVHVAVHVTFLLERRDDAGVDESDDRHRLIDGLLLFVVVGVAALAGSGLDRLATPWQRVSVAALVSIVVTFGAFYGTLCREGGGADGDGGD